MSNSRLEKFIYAICGMDIDDLPTPLSRIETLWNCLITGEVPDFEPLSRNEKYLMAMLNDNIDGLPEPTSRGEKLLYKIATGETDLSDVPGYLSRYEELLKQLIENGGIGGTDFEYVLYTLNDSFSTLYTTAEGPVKSAILSGRTEVTGYSYNGYMLNNHGILSANGELTTVGTSGWSATDSLIKLESGEYYIEDDGTSGDGYTYVYFYTENGEYLDSKSRIDVGVSNTFNIDDLSYVKLSRRKSSVNHLKIYRKDDLKLTSVKMPVLTTTGKNLFDKSKIKKGYAISSSNPTTESAYAVRDYMDYIEVESGATYKLSNCTTTAIFGYKNKGDYYGYVSLNGINAIPHDVKYIRFNIDNSFDYSNAQLEKNTVATSYEPYKTNILTTPSDLESRGIGDVRDELDCLTGELIQRIGEVVLDGSEGRWELAQDRANTMRFNCFNLDIPIGVNGSLLKTDRFPYQSPTAKDQEGAVMAGGVVAPRVPSISILKTRLPSNDIDGFKQWLSQNPITIQYILAEPIVKTVVLSTLDQDGQPTKLSTFNDITHVSIDAEDLLPTIDLEVATKIEETLSSLPTQMIDISEKQQSLNEKIDEQAENINEVSTAMAEIRSDIL